MTRKLGIAILFASIAFAPVHAGPFYAGASWGNTSIEVDEPSLDFDADDPSWKIFGGYRFLKFLGVEASYLDLGSPEDNSVMIETTGFSGFGVGVLPLGPVGLFAKVGVAAMDTEIGAIDESSTDPAYGVGVEFSFFKVAARAEYELFDVEDTDTVQMVSLGAAWQF